MTKAESIATVTKIKLNLTLNDAADLLHVLDYLDAEEMKKRMGMKPTFIGRIKNIRDSLEAIEAVGDKESSRLYDANKAAKVVS